MVKLCVESLRQAHEVIHEVWPTCTLFVQPFTQPRSQGLSSYRKTKDPGNEVAFNLRDDRFHAGIPAFSRQNTFELINMLFAFHR